MNTRYLTRRGGRAELSVDVMRIKRSTLHFNKEMVVAELGSFVGTPLAADFVAQFTKVPRYISFAAVAGGIIGSSVLFIITRLWDKNRGEGKKYRSRELIGDLKYLTPVAFLLALIFYYPVVFFVSRYLLLEVHGVTVSAVAAQMAAFMLIATSLNIYRVILMKKIGKEL